MMKSRITFTINDEIYKLLKEEASKRKITIKKLGEEYFYLMVAKEKLNIKNRQKN